MSCINISNVVSIDLSYKSHTSCYFHFLLPDVDGLFGLPYRQEEHMDGTAKCGCAKIKLDVKLICSIWDKWQPEGAKWCANGMPLSADLMCVWGKPGSF